MNWAVIQPPPVTYLTFTLVGLGMIESYGVAALKADKTHPAPEVDELLRLLGNKAGSIPFYALQTVRIRAR